MPFAPEDQVGVGEDELRRSASRKESAEEADDPDARKRNRAVILWALFSAVFLALMAYALLNDQSNLRKLIQEDVRESRAAHMDGER